MTDKNKEILALIPQSEYDALMGRIDNLWTQAKSRAEYGKFLITCLAKDLTARRGKGFSRPNLIYMRKFYRYFSKGMTVSHLLSRSHYYELLKCEDEVATCKNLLQAQLFGNSEQLNQAIRCLS